MCGIPLPIALPIIILGAIAGITLGYARPDLVFEMRRWMSHKVNIAKFFVMATFVYLLIGTISKLLC